MPSRSLTIAPPQVIPAPNPQRIAVVPSLTFPFSTLSAKAIGIEAAEVLP